MHFSQPFGLGLNGYESILNYQSDLYAQVSRRYFYTRSEHLKNRRKALIYNKSFPQKLTKALIYCSIFLTSGFTKSGFRCKDNSRVVLIASVCFPTTYRLFPFLHLFDLVYRRTLKRPLTQKRGIRRSRLKSNRTTVSLYISCAIVNFLARLTLRVTSV